MQRIMFMGTPEFSRVVLEKMVKNGREPIAVVTRADKPSGRGYNVNFSPVKKFALEQNIEVLQPKTMSDEAFLARLHELQPELIVVVAYGRILPKAVLDFPRYGCINAHASLLPLYRGAAPMQRAIMDGRSETGVTIMKMDEGLDTGAMLLKLVTPITELDDLESVHDRLAELSGDGLLQVISRLENGLALPEEQDDSAATYAAKITNEDAKIDFNRSAKEIACQIRALSPMPYAYCLHGGKILKITGATISDKSGENTDTGTVLSLKNGVIEVACGDGSLLISGVFPESKKRMTATDFINGKKINVGDKLL